MKSFPGLAGFVEPTRLHFRDEPRAKTKTHPHCAEWVQRTLSYPHAGAQLQQQQRRAGQTRMGIGYAASKMASNLALCALQRHLTVSQSSDFPMPRPQARGKEPARIGDSR